MSNENILKPLHHTNKRWWKNEVIYQVYPRSFQDSNGDGIGDINGITSRLDYLQSLGITTIWLSPVYKSPMFDMGYDIADYQKIDPIFGTMKDLDNLIVKAKQHGMKILMDLVVNHTSDQCPWFQEALKDPKSKYRNYYIFKHTDNGKAPNNWRSAFGGSTWSKVPNEPGTYYFHNFAPKQPDLNWENPELRQAIYKIINWWLDKGIAGFRLDAIMQLKKDQDFASLPADDVDGLVNGEKKDLNRPGIEKFLSELKQSTFAKYNALTIGEAYGVPAKDMPRYIGPDGYFSMIFNFDIMNPDIPDVNRWYIKNKWSTADWAKTIFDSQHAVQKAHAYFTNIIENHDQPRAVSKFIQNPKDRTPESAKALAAVYFLLPGVPLIFEGQELGMKNFKRHSISEFNDLSSINNYHMAIKNGYTKEQALQFVNERSRDNGRVPMQWDGSKYGGFSDHKPWLEMGNDREGINVKDEEKDPNSVLNFYRRLVRYRQNDRVRKLFIDGSIEQIKGLSKDIIAYTRTLDGKTIKVIVNFSNHTIKLDQPIKGKIELNSNPKNEDLSQLMPFQAVVVE
ncbi:alpha-glucosidase [Philodulcilactobacillus myokoensis]|uniref:Alpha-glucosidase n=1 Tax=Philodulcilactobacillus myokoensis TaxID=2929573 RepID=A0A9W6AZD0_9LACO|nr:alpha-glucosidase [Philodulcilactobacillus myokoensis]GLB46270.1 alpha-glucosidase [Philodulcilactobacillus myokoensis]